jgi:hypothetical protein
MAAIVRYLESIQLKLGGVNYLGDSGFPVLSMIRSHSPRIQRRFQASS